jgi:DNA primase
LYSNTAPEVSTEEFTTGYGFRKSLKAVKDAVSIEEVAQGYGEFRQSGGDRLLGRCVLPNHEDQTPSMTVYVEEQRFKCYGCGEHGDVIDLVGLAEGCEAWEAMMILAQRYGIELPGRPDSWHRKQARQKPVRDELDRMRVEVLRRRLFRILEPMVRDVEDEALREEVAREVWTALWPQAEHMLREHRKEGAS